MILLMYVCMYRHGFLEGGGGGVLHRINFDVHTENRLTLAATSTVSLSSKSMKTSFFWSLFPSSDVAIGLLAAWLGRVFPPGPLPLGPGRLS